MRVAHGLFLLKLQLCGSQSFLVMDNILDFIINAISKNISVKNHCRVWYAEKNHVAQQNFKCPFMTRIYIHIVRSLLRGGHLEKLHFWGLKQKVETDIPPGLKDNHMVR